MPQDLTQATNLDTLLISGLRRSGTTALWQCLRNLEGVAAFDEPFHPRLAEGARDNPKGTWTELSAFLDTTQTVPQPIAPLEELHPESTADQRAYLDHLRTARPRVAMDVVRCWNRLPGLYDTPERVLSVMLIRDPASWVTGHLMPSGRGTWRKVLANIWRRQSFFTRRGFYNNYHYETIITQALSEDHPHPLWGGVTLPVARLRRAPAYVKLLAFWWGANLASYQALRATDTARHIVTLSEFSAAPDAVLGDILARAGWDDLAPDTAHVTQTRAPFGTTHPKWLSAAQILGIPDSLFAPGGATAQALETAFEAALAEGRSAR